MNFYTKEFGEMKVDNHTCIWCGEEGHRGEGRIRRTEDELGDEYIHEDCEAEEFKEGNNG